MIFQTTHGPWLAKIFSCGKENAIWSRLAIAVDVLPNTLTATVEQLTKAHFAKFGIPERLITDNGPQFISTEYKQFASEYGFEHVTSSPYWPQGNCRAKAAVKIAKRMYQKNKDIHLTLFDYRKNTRQLKGSYPDARGAYFQ